MAKLQLKVGGMHCSFCSQSIVRAYERLDGVERASVSLAHEEALIQYDPDQVDETTLRDTLRSIGYRIRDPDKVRAYEQEQEELEDRRHRTVQGGIASGVVAVAMLVMWLGWQPPVWVAWASGVLAAVIVFGVGREIDSMALAGLRRGIFNQHVLLFFGAVGAFIAGLIGLFRPAFPAFHFFSASIFLMTYHLLSGFTATVVRARSQDAVRRLLDLQPDTARRVEDGEETEVEAAEVEPGDLVRVRPGESIPLDGVVAEGHSTVDNSIVTGEPMPVDVAEGVEVIGGSINQRGTLVVEVTAASEEGFLWQVARHAEQARALKPGVVQLVDWILQYYVPAVLIIGLGAMVAWPVVTWAVTGAADGTRGLYAMLTVFVMGYPCALGMATPLALIRGGGIAAERGVLMRSGESFQVLDDVDLVVLDKTGTITEGKPHVQRVEPLGEATVEEVLAAAGSAEMPSEHPLASAILERAKQAGVTLEGMEDFEAVTGKGVVGRSEGGRRLIVGTPALLEQHGIGLPDGIEGILDELRSDGATAVLVAADDELLGALAIADRIKDDSRDAIDRLRDRGAEPLMLTGDNEVTARAVAEEVGIERVLADVLPDDKAREVGRLQDEGHVVAMVGDGINDAPALTRANVGIAIGAGTDIAIESADVVLVHSRLSGVVDAMEVAGNSYRKTKQNLAAAFAFNGIGVPVAASGLLHPGWAMAAMVASVSLVLANSFGGRLLRGEGVAASWTTGETPGAGHEHEEPEGDEEPAGDEAPEEDEEPQEDEEPEGDETGENRGDGEEDRT